MVVQYGPLAQLGEHSVCTREVVGSTPIGSTMYEALALYIKTLAQHKKTKMRRGDGIR